VRPPGPAPTTMMCFGKLFFVLTSILSVASKCALFQAPSEATPLLSGSNPRNATTRLKWLGHGGQLPVSQPQRVLTLTPISLAHSFRFFLNSNRHFLMCCARISGPVGAKVATDWVSLPLGPPRAEVVNGLWPKHSAKRGWYAHVG
jgi:hypothetical protein